MIASSALGLALGDDDNDALGLVLGDSEGLLLGDADGDNDGELDGEDDSDADGVEEGEALGLELSLLDGLLLGDALGELLGDAEGDEEGDEETEAEGELDTDSLGLALRLLDGLALGDSEGLALTLALGEEEGESLGLALTEADGDSEGDDDGELDGDSLGLELTLPDGLVLGDSETDADGLALGLGLELGDSDGELDTDEDGVEETDVDGEVLGLDETDVLGVELTDPDGEVDGEEDGALLKITFALLFPPSVELFPQYSFPPPLTEQREIEMKSTSISTDVLIAQPPVDVPWRVIRLPLVPLGIPFTPPVIVVVVPSVNSSTLAKPPVATSREKVLSPLNVILFAAPAPPVAKLTFGNVEPPPMNVLSFADVSERWIVPVPVIENPAGSEFVTGVLVAVNVNVWLPNAKVFVPTLVTRFLKVAELPFRSNVPSMSDNKSSEVKESCSSHEPPAPCTPSRRIVLPAVVIWLPVAVDNKLIRHSEANVSVMPETSFKLPPPASPIFSRRLSPLKTNDCVL